MVDSTGRAPANVGAGASTPETLLLTPPPNHHPQHTTPPPKQTNKQNWPSFNSQLQLCVQRELGACFSAPIALSPSRLLSEVWKCTFFHLRICWSLPASGLWAPWGQEQDIHCAFPTSRSRVALPSDRRDFVPVRELAHRVRRDSPRFPGDF